MSYIGKPPQTGNFLKLDSLTASATASYTMQHNSANYSPESVNHMLVSLNGVIQSPTTAYTISGSTLTFASALTSSDSIDFIMVFGNVLDIGTPSDSTVSLAKLTATGTASSSTFLRGDNSWASAGSPSITDNGNANAITIDSDENVNLTQNLTVVDDKGITFGTGADWHLAAAAGEGSIQLFRGADNTQGSDEGKISFSAGATGNESAVMVVSGEGESSDARVYLYNDQGDDSDNTWLVGADEGSAVFDVGMNTTRQNIKFDGNGNGYADATWQDNTWDYAELFPWKTLLINDDYINALWGKSVVLDGDFVRIAEEGEEEKVIGVVRPKGSTSSHGDGLQWQGKWKKDVWGNYEKENYTRITWQENGYRHSYPKDRIPTHRLKMGIGEDKDIHKKESSFELDKNGNKIPVVVPKTAKEKSATNYLERTHKKGRVDVPLERRIYTDTYDPNTSYNRREDRPKEWVLIGMLGQVPVRDTAIIPTHWKKMKNLESGIDKYFIFNK